MVMKKRFHLAIGVKNIEDSIQEYTNRFGCKPVIVVKNEYALFKTDCLNVSIRKVITSDIGVRHVGWESEKYTGFEEEKDCNGLIWETFREEDQMKEIKGLWSI
jgi:hypothetical protein